MPATFSPSGRHLRRRARTTNGLGETCATGEPWPLMWCLLGRAIGDLWHGIWWLCNASWIHNISMIHMKGLSAANELTSDWCGLERGCIPGGRGVVCQVAVCTDHVTGYSTVGSEFAEIHIARQCWCRPRRILATGIQRFHWSMGH